MLKKEHWSKDGEYIVQTFTKFQYFIFSLKGGPTLLYTPFIKSQLEQSSLNRNIKGRQNHKAYKIIKYYETYEQRYNEVEVPSPLERIAYSLSFACVNILRVQYLSCR